MRGKTTMKVSGRRRNVKTKTREKARRTKKGMYNANANRRTRPSDPENRSRSTKTRDSRKAGLTRRERNAVRRRVAEMRIKQKL